MNDNGADYFAFRSTYNPKFGSNFITAFFLTFFETKQEFLSYIGWSMDNLETINMGWISNGLIEGDFYHGFDKKSEHYENSLGLEF